MTFGVALEVLRKEYNCQTMTGDDYCKGGHNCDPGICKNYVDDEDVTDAIKTVLDTFPTQMSGTSGNISEIPNSSDLVSRSYLLAEYDRQHQGPPGGARKIIEEAPPVLASVSQTKFKPGSKFLLEIGEKRIGLDEYSIVGTDLYVRGSLLEKLTPYEADGDVEFWKRRTKDYENTVNDLISKMTKGVKFNCMEMNAEGITFREEKPSVQAEQKKGDNE